MKNKALSSNSPLGNSLTFSAGMQLPPVTPLREVVSEYSTSWPNSKWLVLPIKLLKWKNTSWSCSSVSMKPKLSYNRDHINFRMGFKIVNCIYLQNSNEPLVHLKLFVVLLVDTVD